MPHAIAFDLGGSHAACAVVDEHRVLAQRTLDLDARAGLAPRLEEFADAARAVCAEAGLALADCAGCAMGLPCVVEPGTNRVLKTFGKYDDTATLDLAGWTREALGLALATENDARVALLGEAACGAARGFADAVMLTLGTGIGTAAIIGGRLVVSKHALAGSHGGHLPIFANGQPCICGNLGCAETEGATWALPRVVADLARRHPEAARGSPLPAGAGAAEAGREQLGFHQVFALAHEGDALAREVRDHCLRAWAACAVVNAQAYDAELIVLGGGVMRSAKEILPAVRELVRAQRFACLKMEVHAAELGNAAALLGALPLLRSVGLAG